MISTQSLRVIPRPSAVRPAIKIENVMLSGHGRLILHDGTDLPIGYRLVHNEYGSWCSGTLIGNVQSVAPGSFCEGVDVELDGRLRLVALITGYSERHLNFVAKYDGVYAQELSSRRVPGQPSCDAQGSKAERFLVPDSSLVGAS